MRLGYYYHVPAILRGGDIYTAGPQGRFLESMARHCQDLICFLHSPREAEAETMDYRIKSKNVRLVDMGDRGSVFHRILHAGHYKSKMEPMLHGLDAILFRAPSPLIAVLAKRIKVPAVLMIVGDYVTGIDDMVQPFWRREVIRIWAKWNKREQNIMAGQTLTFVNSRYLYEEMRPKTRDLYEIRTSTLLESDFYERTDTCLVSPYRLLYTGRLSRAKGLFEILEAVEILVKENLDIVLDIVGPAEKGEDLIKELIAKAEAVGIRERLFFHGYRSIEKDLFDLYRNADIFVLASRSSEGFPRSIWEALASGLPVVASRVGSIPHYLDDKKNAILVSPGSARELSVAIRQVVSNAELRRELIRNGYYLARENTAAKRAEEMAGVIVSWLSKVRSTPNSFV